MTDDEKKAAVKSAYLSPNWEEKVQKMDAKQVAAIYARLKAQGKLK